MAMRIAIDGGLCEDCHKELGGEVHHMVCLSPQNISDPDISLNHRRLRLLCHACHANRHGKRIESQARYIFDEKGQPTPP